MTDKQAEKMIQELGKLNDNQVIIRFGMFTLITIMIKIFFGHVIDWAFKGGIDMTEEQAERMIKELEQIKNNTVTETEKICDLMYCPQRKRIGACERRPSRYDN